MTRAHRIAVGLIIAMILLTLPSWVSRNDSTAGLAQRELQLDEARARNEELRLQNQLLLDEVRALSDDPYSVELRSREELRYVRPGEVVLVFEAPPRAPDRAGAWRRSRTQGAEPPDNLQVPGPGPRRGDPGRSGGSGDAEGAVGNLFGGTR